MTGVRPIAIDAAWLRRHPLPRPDDAGDKRSRGQVLVVAGANEMPGAALLCAVGTLRAGAGRLQVATTERAAPLVASAVPEARVIALPETRGGALSAAAAARLEELGAEADAVVVGPGMLEAVGTSRMLARWLVGLPAIPVVIDAAALCALPIDAEGLAAARASLILTPHAGEAARLLGQPREDVESDPLHAATSISRTFDAVCVMKGATSYIVGAGSDGGSATASASASALSNTRGNVGLAMSGSGDTLAGIIGGLAARGASPLVAAAWGVHLHASAADAIEARQGTLGFLARELLDEIPGIMNGLDGGPSRTRRR